MNHKKIDAGLREQIFKNTWAVFEEFVNLLEKSNTPQGIN